MKRPFLNPAKSARRIYPVVLLSLIILFCAVLKIRHNNRPFFTGVDGGLYTDIAEHVRDGDGLVTDVSPYHHGYAAFPHPTAIYPLWPLVYGYLGRLVPMRIAGVWVPTLGYLVALVFAYLWAGTLKFPSWLPRPAGQGDGPADSVKILSREKPSRMWNAIERLAHKAFSGINPGHVLVLFLGLNVKFFAYTSLPYTEGLGYALFFACLWRFQKIGRTASLAHAAEMGGWLAALMLIRSHFFVVAMAAFLALGAVAFCSRSKRAWLRLVLAGAVFAALMIPWYVHISGFIPHGRLMSMFRYDQARANDLLSPFQAIVAADNVNAFLRDRLLGLKVAFSPSSESSYVLIFHGLPYVLPLFVFLALARHLRNRQAQTIKTGLIALKSSSFELVFLVLLSVGSFASLQFMHIDLAQPWLFNQRHAIIMLVPFFLAWLSIARSKRTIWITAAAIIGVYTILASFMDCWNAGAEEFIAAQRLRPISQWFVKQAYDRDNVIVVATVSLPQLLAPQVPRVGFHCVYKGTIENDLRVLFETFGADLLIMEDQDIGGRLIFRNIDPGWFSRYFEQKTRLPGYTIFVKRTTFDPEGNGLTAERSPDP